MKEDCKNPIISLMENQKSINKGGTMRLVRESNIEKSLKLKKCIIKVISRRQRHQV